ncbi:hypothetical protein BGX38DRAFT_161830 [Terfezia claveryi]|nr:hypothetical protein BGX38DRAFT_161830 [Terfezia claveryi]
MIRDPAVSQQEPFIGSGFFVNIPGTERDILFTAGHNLINEHGALVHSVDVYVDGELISTVRVHGDDYHISESYIKTPNNTNPINDYGCILIKKREVTPKLREGFGFSLALADRDLRTMGLSAFVGGYPAGLNSPSTTEFRYAMGSFGKVDANQLHYHATTEKGQSGGPVWVLYKGYETVIGIHNHDQRSPGSGNRATRINIRTLYDMYRWAGVTSAAYSKPLKVSDYEAEPGLFLKFDPVTKSAVARLGTDGASTMFDLIPAHTAPTDAKREPRYAIINKPDLTADESKWHWLKFDVNPKSRPHQVTASVGKATEEGMVRFHSPTEGPELEQNYIKIEAAPLSSQALSGDEDRYLLRVEGRGMPSEVVENTKAESPDVLLVNITKNPALKDEFTDFQMQMNMPE